MGIKVAVWCAKANTAAAAFSLHEAATGKMVWKGRSSADFGAYGPFTHTRRLDFSAWRQAGAYYLACGESRSPVFRIGADVYKGAADFCLQYMRQQRSGFNPYLKDSCHTQDGFTVYGPMPDGTHIDVAGGWHDASDYLQYVTTSANAAYHLLAAWRDFKPVFTDAHAANGLAGGNGVADVLDEARWGLNWLLKMHPADDQLYNQVADDRDHRGMRLPTKDTASYGKGLERPVYFCTGLPQGLRQYKNRSTGLASTAGKFAGAFALGAALYKHSDTVYSALLARKAASAYALGAAHPGVCQTAPCGAPYFYEEDNWMDDMELGAAMLSQLPGHKGLLQQSLEWAKTEPLTPWMGADTARHYQWYPFHNFGHYELAAASPATRQTTMGYYRQGINAVWQKARHNAFYRGIPFIWCSNNLTVSFAIQCNRYRHITKDNRYQELEQANIDWLFGCNPWGTTMVAGLPAGGDFPEDPHSSFSHLYNYPVHGGLVDGPVYGSIYKGLIGITLHNGDEYAAFQSDLAVYHDDFGDYSTNEPTMDGTASLVYLLAAQEYEARPKPAKGFTYSHGAIIRGDSTHRRLALVFTADEFDNGIRTIDSVLKKYEAPASFFFTGRFYREPAHKGPVLQLRLNGHYLGPHSDQHLLYNDWSKRDSLLVTREQFNTDLQHCYEAMAQHGIRKEKALWFLPPYEWYNDTITTWTKARGLQLINYTPGTLSHADYTWPQLPRYRSCDVILRSIRDYEQQHPAGLNGFILLLHAGADPRRTDTCWDGLDKLLAFLHEKNYTLVTVPALLQQH